MVHFDVIISSQEQLTQEGYDYSNPTRVYFEDFLHLLISYIAHDTSFDIFWGSKNSNDTNEDEKPSLRPYLLRQAVGVNKFTSSVTDLDPRKLYPLGANVILEWFSRGLGLKGFFEYLLDHQMLSLSAYTVTTLLPTADSQKSPESLVSSITSLWNQIQQIAKKESPELDPKEKLRYVSHERRSLSPSLSQEEYVTLGSDKSLQYLNKYLR